MSSPGVSEPCSSSGMGDDGGAGSASKKPRGRAQTQVVASARGRGKGVNTKHVFKTTATTTASPTSDDDFSALSRGRGTKSGQHTGIQRALLQSIDEASAPAAVKAHAGQTTHVGAAGIPPAKRAPQASVRAATATQEAMLEQQTQDVAGQEAAPCLQFQVLHVRCVCLCG